MAAQSNPSRAATSRGDALRERIVDANDGIIATAGIIEGFLGAGAGDAAVIFAALIGMIVGGLGLAAAKYAEVAMQSDAHRAIIEGERRLLALSPDEEQAELAALFREKGVSPELAARVAEELSTSDALASQLELEYGITLGDEPRPLVTAGAAFGAFLLGAVIPLAAALLAPDDVRAVVTLGAVVIALTLTAAIAARWGGIRLWRTVTRTVLIGVFAIGASLGAGYLLTH
ncbi:VIT1/CCC1 transporter family protein [Rathayibacter sp. CAU 1779]